MKRRRGLVWLVVAGLLAATAVATVRAWSVEHDQARDANMALAHQVAAGVDREVEFIAVAMRGSEAVLARGELDPRRFRVFASQVLERSAFPALGFAQIVPESGREAFEERTGEQLKALTPAGFKPAPERPIHAPIVAIHPRDARFRRLVGFDLLSNPARRAALLEARASREPRLTEPVEEAASREPGAVAIYPVTRTGAPPDAQPAGYFSAGVAGRRIVSAVRRRLEFEGPVRVTDGGAVVAGSAAMPDGSQTDTVRVGGRAWEVTVAPAVSADVAPAIAFLLGGLALTGLAGAVLWSAGRRERELLRRRAAAEQRIERESLLARIADSVEREIELEGRLASLAGTLVPAIADLCSVFVVTPEGSVRRSGIASTEPAVERLLAAEATPPATSPVRAAIASRQPVLMTRVAQSREGRGAAVARPAWPPRTAEELRAGVLSNMIVPLQARNRVLGAISMALFESGGRPPYDRSDVAFAGEVASHAAIALDNARLYEQQREIAVVLQQALLPPSLPEIAGADVAARHRPGLDGAEVGGDFYDLFETEDGWMAVLGDVCGKGPDAAALTALVRHTLRATAGEGPAGAVARVHEAIRSTGELTYCTLCCAELHRNGAGVAAHITTAGHPQPYLIRRDGSVRRLPVTGPLVGALDDPSYGVDAVELGPGETLFICSDGVLEARHGSELFGEERLEGLLAEHAALAPAELIARLEEEVVAFVEGRQRDDLALLALRARDASGER